MMVKLLHGTYDGPTLPTRRLMQETYDSLDLIGFINETCDILGPRGWIHELYDTPVIRRLIYEIYDRPAPRGLVHDTCGTLAPRGLINETCDRLTLGPRGLKRKHNYYTQSLAIKRLIYHTNYYSVIPVFRRQNLTSMDVRLKSILALKGLKYGRRPIT